MADAAELLLLEICRSLEDLHAGRRLTWASHRSLHERLPHVTEAQLDVAIAAAIQRGLIEGGGQPAHSLLLTAKGRSAIASTVQARRRRRRQT